MDLNQINRITKKYGNFTLDEYFEISGNQYAIYIIDSVNKNIIYQDGLNNAALNEKCQESDDIFNEGISALYGPREIDEIEHSIDVLMVNSKVVASGDKELLELLVFHEVIHLIDVRGLIKQMNIDLSDSDKAVGQKIQSIANKLDEQIGSGFGNDQFHNANFGAILFYYLKRYDKNECYQLLSRAMIKNFFDDYTEDFRNADN